MEGENASRRRGGRRIVGRIASAWPGHGRGGLSEARTSPSPVFVFKTSWFPDSQSRILRPALWRPICNAPRTMARGKGSVFAKDGVLRPFRLLRQDWGNLSVRYVSDWTIFNQLIFASAVYVFFTNLLPGITFASDLYELTGENWGTIEVVFSTGLCGIIFSLYACNPWDCGSGLIPNQQILHPASHNIGCYGSVFHPSREHLLAMHLLVSCECPCLASDALPLTI